MKKWTDYERNPTLDGTDEVMVLDAESGINKRATMQQMKDYCSGETITSTEVNSAGYLIITYSDGKRVNVGKVTGDTVQIDASLTIQGAAADAKQTGDSIQNLTTQIEKLRNQISGGGSGGETGGGGSGTVALTGAGFGIGNSYSNPEGGIKSNYGSINAAFIKAIAKAGFKFIRIIIDIGKNNWSAGQNNQQNYADGYTGGTMDFIISPAWLSELKKLADLCKSNGLQLTICPFGWQISWAQVQGSAPSSGYSNWGAYYWASPNNITKAYCVAFLSRLWTQLAAAFKGYSDSVTFEIVNEPLNVQTAKSNNMYNWSAYNGASSAYSTTQWSDDWQGFQQYNYSTKKYYEVSPEASAVLAEMELKAIKAIRDVGAQNLILCPTYAQNSASKWIKYIHENVVKASKDTNCKVAVHWYLPDTLSGSNVKSGAVFNANSDDYVGKYYNASVVGDGVVAYEAGLLGIKYALDNNIPLVITEGSVCMSKTRVTDAERLKWATDINANIIKKGVPFSLFDNGCLLNGSDLRAASGEDYGVMDRIKLTFSDTAMTSKFVS